MVQGTEMSAFECMFGRPPFFPQDAAFLPREGVVSTDVQRYLTEVTGRIDLVKKIAEQNSREMQQRRAKKPDQKQDFLKFNVGTIVWLKRAKPPLGVSHKLVSPYHKELMVVTKASDYDTYHLKMRDSGKILAHPVHASRLKKYIEPVDKSVQQQQTDVSVPSQPQTQANETGDSAAAPADQQLNAPIVGDNDPQPTDQPADTGAGQAKKHPTRGVQAQKPNDQQQPSQYSPALGWYPARIVKFRKRGPNREFLVDFGRKYKKEWCTENDVTPALVEHYFKTHTLAGKRRKRPLNIDN